MDRIELALRVEIRDCIRVAQLTQMQVAEALHVTPKHLSQMLTGRAGLRLGWAADIAGMCDRELIISTRILPVPPPRDLGLPPTPRRLQ